MSKGAEKLYLFGIPVSNNDQDTIRKELEDLATEHGLQPPLELHDQCDEAEFEKWNAARPVRTYTVEAREGHILQELAKELRRSLENPEGELPLVVVDPQKMVDGGLVYVRVSLRDIARAGIPLKVQKGDQWLDARLQVDDGSDLGTLSVMLE